MPDHPAFDFDNSYARLPEHFYAHQAPTPVSAPQLIRLNEPLALSVGLDPRWLTSGAGVATLSGNQIPSGATPIATAYAGHQFGGWNPQLGDGRAVLLGELIDGDGKRTDLQLKGSGPTPYSRGGDGRAPLGPVLREYVVSEAMHTLGVPTSRALAAVTTGDWVMRDQALPGAVLTRLASSHIRIGTFQYFAARNDTEALELLAQHVIERHFPEAGGAANPVLALLQGAVAGQARLVAQWQLLGFIHGVMNTDNMLLCAETIDYGPCAFMDRFDPDTVFSSIDQGGRYAYRNQPAIAHWNLANLAQCLLPLIDQDPEQSVALAQKSVDDFQALFLEAHSSGMARKLGLGAVKDSDEQMVQDLLTLMHEQRCDFTLTFRRLTELANPQITAMGEINTLPDVFEPWLVRWRARLASDSLQSEARAQVMRHANPVLIPRNHQLEAVISSAVNEQDFAPFHTLVEALSQPFDYRPEHAYLAAGPQPGQEVKNTFCGT